MVKFQIEQVVDELRSRGVEDIFTVSIDGLKGFGDAISTIFPEAQIQRCMVHQIRNTLRFMNYQDRKSYAQQLKNIYNVTNAESAFQALEALKMTFLNLRQLLEVGILIGMSYRFFFNFPMEIRKMIYTTNIIESLNSQFRKVSNSRSIYPSEDALLKILYLSSKNIMKKWNQKIRGWEGILRMLSIEYEGRLEKYLK
ncbi:transposase [Cetobacterium somerae]|uniref:IS256 family transposase n=2 Tax=unclassified Cetobacterium TaxID=2630983 RepID=UPI002115E74D|nr:transposase [Cetobacterium sp. NK01]MCQ8213681.1 transposase [Cetobacterium sp. NK01]